MNDSSFTEFDHSGKKSSILDKNDSESSKKSLSPSQSLSSSDEEIKALGLERSISKNSKELKIVFQPMLTRNDIADVDKISDLEEFYLTEIEQQQNHDLIEKLNLAGMHI